MASSHLLLSASIAMLIAGKFLTGCAAPPPPPPPVVDEWKSDQPPHLIPNTAIRVAEGTAPLSYLSSSPVTVYFLDNDAHTLLNASEVLQPRGEIFMIQPNEKAIVIKNTRDTSPPIVLAAPIDTSHRFSIWVVRAKSTTQP